MAYNVRQFRDLITRVVLQLGVGSTNAVELLLGTAAVESNFGTYLVQLVGPAKGPFQMEPATFHDLQYRYKGRFPEIAKFAFEEQEWDLRAAIIMARVKYLDNSEPIPDTLEGRAGYWKKYYNSRYGKGTPEKYIAKYYLYVKE